MSLDVEGWWLVNGLRCALRENVVVQGFDVLRGVRARLCGDIGLGCVVIARWI